MAETLSELETRRRELFQELATLGDFRPGMISVNYRKCGKPNCACAQPGQRGMDHSTCGTQRRTTVAARR